MHKQDDAVWQLLLPKEEYCITPRISKEQKARYYLQDKIHYDPRQDRTPAIHTLQTQEYFHFYRLRNFFPYRIPVLSPSQLLLFPYHKYLLYPILNRAFSYNRDNILLPRSQLLLRQIHTISPFHLSDCDVYLSADPPKAVYSFSFFVSLLFSYFNTFYICFQIIFYYINSWSVDYLN